MNTTDDNAKPRGDVSIEGDQPIRFAGSILGAQRHVCAFFHTADEEYRVLLPFIEDGFECGNRAFHVVDPKRREEHEARLNYILPRYSLVVQSSWTFCGTHPIVIIGGIAQENPFFVPP